MTVARRRFPGTLPAVVAIVALIVVACGSSTPSTVPSASPTAAPTAAPTATPTPAASATTAPAPTAAPPSASAVAACPIVPQSGRLPSDRLVDVVISTSATTDLVTFVFGDMSVPDPPQGASEGELSAAEPPYTGGASGLPIEVAGEHVAGVRFSGMWLMSDIGEPTYTGGTEFSLDLPALRSVVNYDMSEGIIGWYIGYDGNGCVTLRSDAAGVTVAIDHPSS